MVDQMQGLILDFQVLSRGMITYMRIIILYVVAFGISRSTSQTLIDLRIHRWIMSEISREAKSALIGLILVEFAVIDSCLMVFSVQLTLIENPHGLSLHCFKFFDLFLLTWIKLLCLFFENRNLLKWWRLNFLSFTGSKTSDGAELDCGRCNRSGLLFQELAHAVNRLTSDPMVCFRRYRYGQTWHRFNFIFLIFVLLHPRDRSNFCNALELIVSFNFWATKFLAVKRQCNIIRIWLQILNLILV